MQKLIDEIWDIVHMNGDYIIIPFDNMTIELQSYWISKFLGKRKVEYKIYELDTDFKVLENDEHLIRSIYYKLI